MGSESNDHGEHEGEESGEHSHHTSVFMGVVALSGMYLFFIMERLMVLITDWKHKKRKRVQMPYLFSFLCVQNL